MARVALCSVPGLASLASSDKCRLGTEQPDNLEFHETLHCTALPHKSRVTTDQILVHAVKQIRLKRVQQPWRTKSRSPGVYYHWTTVLYCTTVLTALGSWCAATEGKFAGVCLTDYMKHGMHLGTELARGAICPSHSLYDVHPMAQLCSVERVSQPLAYRT